MTDRAGGELRSVRLERRLPLARAVVPQNNRAVVGRFERVDRVSGDHGAVASVDVPQVARRLLAARHTRRKGGDRLGRIAAVPTDALFAVQRGEQLLHRRAVRVVEHVERDDVLDLALRALEPQRRAVAGVEADLADATHRCRGQHRIAEHDAKVRRLLRPRRKLVRVAAVRVAHVHRGIGAGLFAADAQKPTRRLSKLVQHKPEGRVARFRRRKREYRRHRVAGARWWCSGATCLLDAVEVVVQHVRREEGAGRELRRCGVGHRSHRACVHSHSFRRPSFFSAARMPRKFHSNSRKALDDEDWDIAAPAKSKGAESGSLLRDDVSSVASSATGSRSVGSRSIRSSTNDCGTTRSSSTPSTGDRTSPTRSKRSSTTRRTTAASSRPSPTSRPRATRTSSSTRRTGTRPSRWTTPTATAEVTAVSRKIVLSPGTFYGGSYARECNFGRSPRVSARRGWGRRAGGKGGERQDVAGWYVSPSSESTCQACLPSGRRRRRPSSAAPPRESR